MDSRFFLKAYYKNSKALIMGINVYANLSPLSYAVNDAVEIGKILENEYMFLKENIILLINQDATRSKILSAYTSLTNTEADDRVIVFYAGHGYTRASVRGEVGFLAPYDADINDLSTFIRWDELTRQSELIPAKHMLFIMDACYGGLMLNRSISSGSTRFLKDMFLRYSRQVLTAGKANEAVSDSGGPIPEHSVFTGHLIEGLKGNACIDGIITANSLMAYVYNKVARDTNSNQTPHYGYFFGDGDFILKAPDITEDDNNDYLVVIPYSEEFIVEDINSKIQKCKTLLASEASSIELHDFVIKEIKNFLSGINEDSFPLSASFTKKELLIRITNYEKASSDLAAIVSCISYWAKPFHYSIIKKIFSRVADHIDVHAGGSYEWLNLQWYPLIILFYSAGIAAIEGNRYDSLAQICSSSGASSKYEKKYEDFISSIANGILELTRIDVFKQIPEYERRYTPMSDYLFKILQPKFDDTLFIGKDYERAFDKFETFFALIVADKDQEKGNAYIWGPVGRFAWKEKRSKGSPLTDILNEAIEQGSDWLPIKEGFFGSSLERFKNIATKYLELIIRLNWSH